MKRFSSANNTMNEAAEMEEMEAFFRQQDPVDIAAVDWHSRQEQGLTRGEQAEFQQWLLAHPAHSTAYQQLELDMAALREHARNTKPDTSAATNRQKPRQFYNRPPFHRVFLGMCCVLLLTFGAGIGGYHWMNQPFTETYFVGRGQPHSILLSDGTELTLDAQTKVRIRWYEDRREVRINDGQVMFNVAPDSDKPFQVLAGSARVTVVGTTFSVRYRRTGMDAKTVGVAVEEGHVQVADSGRWFFDNVTNVVDLVAGQALHVAADGTVGQVTTINPDSIALWRKGLIRFDNTRLADALIELEHYGATGLLIRDPVVAALSIGGSYQVDRPEDFARMVSQILPVKLVKNAAGKTEFVQTR